MPVPSARVVDRGALAAPAANDHAPGDMHVRARLTRKRVRGRLCPAGPIDPKTKKPTGRHFKFRVKSGQVVKGWDDGISQLSLGEKARITIPAGEHDFHFLPSLCCAGATVLCTAFRVRDCALAMCMHADVRERQRARVRRNFPHVHVLPCAGMAAHLTCLSPVSVCAFRPGIRRSRDSGLDPAQCKAVPRGYSRRHPLTPARVLQSLSCIIVMQSLKQGAGRRPGTPVRDYHS